MDMLESELICIIEVGLSQNMRTKSRPSRHLHTLHYINNIKTIGANLTQLPLIDQEDFWA